jgi:hypothetical protein
LSALNLLRMLWRCFQCMMYGSRMMYWQCY